MDLFRYKDGRLWCEGVAAEELAGRYGTPTYVYSRGTLVHHLDELSRGFAPVDPFVCFSVKSCPNVHVLRTLVERGAGMDVVSLGEMHRALAAGCPPERIVFAGVGKDEAELRAALVGSTDPGYAGAPRPIAMINAESAAEVDRIARVAAGLGVRAGVAVRVNPLVEAGGHAYIKTATHASKFGVTFDQCAQIAAAYRGSPSVWVRGVHVHIGSSITTPEPYEEAITRVVGLVERLGSEGTAIDHVDIGGGFAADYTTGQAPAIPTYAQRVVPLLLPLRRRGVRVMLEPGRMIAGNSGVLLVRVLYVKRSAEKTFVICDAGMNALLRPALYDAFHFVWPVRVGPGHEPVRRERTPGMAGLASVDVVGPLCESGDFLARDRALPPVEPGDVLAVFTAGAYGMSMANRYNSRGLPAEVMVSGEASRLVRRRESVDDVIAHELDAG